MMLSRWRRVATGVAAGIIVLVAALIGASFRSDNSAVSVASDVRPATVIPILEDPIDEPDSTDSVDTTADDAAETTADDADVAEATGADTSDADDSEAGEAVTVIETDDLPDADDAADTGQSPGTESPAGDDDGNDATTTDDSTTTDDAGSDATPSAPEPPVVSTDEALGTGGGVDDAECALDRLVIYAGARRSGVAGSIRNALARAGFAAACPSPVTVLASNCPLQFAGVLGAGSGYDPLQSFVASSSSVDRETMTAVMGAVGYSGAEINILDFSFVNPDKPGEQWMAIFIPPSFTGWEELASRAGLGATSSSLCAPSGELAG